jgi:hypothetical protein
VQLKEKGNTIRDSKKYSMELLRELKCEVRERKIKEATTAINMLIIDFKSSRQIT